MHACPFFTRARAILAGSISTGWPDPASHSNQSAIKIIEAHLNYLPDTLDSKRRFGEV